MRVVVMVRNMNRHMDEQDVEKYSMGALSEDDAAEIEEHLLVCESCQNLVTESDVYVAAMQAAGGELRRHPHKQRKRSSAPLKRLGAVLAIAALFLIALGVSLKVMRPGALPVAVALEATRGAGVQAPAGQPLQLHLDLTGLEIQGSCRVEVVDHLGQSVWSGTAVPHASGASVLITGVPAGTYFVRVQDSTGRLLREFGLGIGG